MSCDDCRYRYQEETALFTFPQNPSCGERYLCSHGPYYRELRQAPPRDSLHEGINTRLSQNLFINGCRWLTRIFVDSQGATHEGQSGMDGGPIRQLSKVDPRCTGFKALAERSDVVDQTGIITKADRERVCFIFRKYTCRNDCPRWHTPLKTIMVSTSAEEIYVCGKMHLISINGLQKLMLRPVCRRSRGIDCGTSLWNTTRVLSRISARYGGSQGNMIPS